MRAENEKCKEVNASGVRVICIVYLTEMTAIERDGEKSRKCLVSAVHLTPSFLLELIPEL